MVSNSQFSCDHTYKKYDVITETTLFHLGFVMSSLPGNNNSPQTTVHQELKYVLSWFLSLIGQEIWWTYMSEVDGDIMWKIKPRSL